MGVIANLSAPLASQIKTLNKNASSNMSLDNMCPVVNQVQGAYEGVNKGDFKMATFNAGIIALSLAPTASFSGKVAMSNANLAASAVALSGATAQLN